MNEIDGILWVELNEITGLRHLRLRRLSVWNAARIITWLMPDNCFVTAWLIIFWLLTYDSLMTTVGMTVWWLPWQLSDNCPIIGNDCNENLTWGTYVNICKIIYGCHAYVYSFLISANIIWISHQTLDCFDKICLSVNLKNVQMNHDREISFSIE